jgi:uronate dehydrogenase
MLYDNVFQQMALTGAAGVLGTVLRPALRPLAQRLHISDILPMHGLQDNEEAVICDLADKASVNRLLAGCQAVVHMGGIPTERPFEEILKANIQGVFHLYEAARVHGVQRVVFASSNHVSGFRQAGERVDTLAPRRPDSYYGISKSYGEDVAQFYFDRYGIQSVSLRIGSCVEKPENRRSRATWLSYRDLCSLVKCALLAPNVGHTVIYGVSNNDSAWWDNSQAAKLGYAPQDNAESFSAALDALPPLDMTEPKNRFQGGSFVSRGPF